MQAAEVLGTTHATIKHESLHGQRLIVVQPLGVNDQSDGPPLIAVDQFASSRGDRVMITSDGAYARQIVSHDSTPIRWYTLGIIDS